jgi:sugar phosphate isomerase/epimerase
MIKISGATFLGGLFPERILAHEPDRSEKAGEAKTSGKTAGGKAPEETRKSVPGKKRSEYPFRIAINTATVSGYKLPVEKQIELCAEAGYEGIELWVGDVRNFLAGGGRLETLAAQIRDSGLQLENMIGFAPWMTGEKGMAEMKEEMELMSRLGSKYIAATCVGVETPERDQFPVYSAQLRELIVYGEQVGILPLLELWGHHALNQLTDITAIALGARHEKAAILLDFYHLYRGGNSFESLALLNGKKLPVFHINDYPGHIPFQKLKDADRVFPGDGICPFQEVLPVLYKNEFRGALSLELFNPGYWEKYTAKELLKVGYEKITGVMEAAL